VTKLVPGINRLADTRKIARVPGIAPCDIAAVESVFCLLLVATLPVTLFANRMTLWRGRLVAARVAYHFQPKEDAMAKKATKKKKAKAKKKK
jgi:hypothetical protein